MKNSVFLWITLFCIMACKPKNEYTQISDEQYFSQQYVGSSACKQCHLQEFEHWKTSDHFKAMQKPNDSTVLGDFSGGSYTADGVSSRFYKKDNDFFVYTEGNDGNYHHYKILYTFGYKPLQQYLVESESGKLQVIRQSWDSEKKRWFHQYKDQKIVHTDWLHWTGNAQNWNMMCAYCHSTHLEKNYHPETDSYTTSFSELTVGCESCHGAGKQHINFFSQNDKNVKNPPKLLTDVYTQKSEINTCMPCHSRRGEVGGNYIFSEEVLDNFIPEIPAVPLYFADGQVLDENYKYASFLQSKMYQSGVKCSSCHNVHTTELKQPGYKVCLQCHNSEKYDNFNHTFHKDNNCINCHMPVRTYMGNDVRHDHIFRVPRPDLSEKYNVPNVCISCHSDKSNKWAAESVKKHFGNKRKPHFAEDLILSSFSNPNQNRSLQRLLADSLPAIVRATAVFYMNGNVQFKDTLLKKTNDKEAIIRYQAIRSLMDMPSPQTSQVLLSCLSDPVRAVRIAAADVLLTQNGISQMKNNVSFEKARHELEEFLLHQSDFAQGSAALADYYMKIGENSKAVLFYERALKKDQQLNYVRINLAILYNDINDDQKALSTLKDALHFDAENQDIIYRIALLLYQMKRFEDSASYFQKILQSDCENIRVYYNYALLLNEMGEKNKALSVIKKGLQKEPKNTDLQEVLYYISTTN